MLVVDRWNSWVRVLDPVSGVTHWIDLSDIEYETIPSRTGSE